MTDRLVPSWPRLSVEDAVPELAGLVNQSALTASSLVNLSVEGLRFYPTAPVRIARTDLESLRADVLAIAAEHGHPYVLTEPVAFDRKLAVLFGRTVRMLPVEAADPDIWAFLALRVLPDVVIWRWPLELEDVEPIDSEGDGAQSRAAFALPGSERILGGRRGMLREAWWRARLLGADACERLPEADNFIQLTDRISLTGDARISRLLVDAHLRRVGGPGYSQRMALRRALVLVGRSFGRISVDAISDEHAARVIEEAFDRAADETRGSSEHEAVPRPARVDASAVGTVRERFLMAGRPYAEALESAMLAVSYDEITKLRLEAEAHIEELGGSEIGRRIIVDLTELVEDWTSLDDDAKAATHAALTYVIESDDVRADSGPEGLVDDDEVVQALFDSLDRTRPGA